MMSALAPIVILSIVSCLAILIQAGTLYVWGWALWATANAGLSTGDLGVAVLLLRYPKNAFIVDDQAGARVFLPPYEDRIT